MKIKDYLKLRKTLNLLKKGKLNIYFLKNINETYTDTICKALLYNLNNFVFKDFKILIFKTKKFENNLYEFTVKFKLHFYKNDLYTTHLESCKIRVFNNNITFTFINLLYNKLKHN